MEFEKYPKIRRAKHDQIVITEKLDGTNAQIAIDEQGNMQVGSRNRWITPGKQTDNYGFAAWAERSKAHVCITHATRKGLVHVPAQPRRSSMLERMVKSDERQ